jgi:hypothetical protein
MLLMIFPSIISPSQFSTHKHAWTKTDCRYEHRQTQQSRQHYNAVFLYVRERRRRRKKKKKKKKKKKEEEEKESKLESCLLSYNIALSGNWHSPPCPKLANITKNIFIGVLLPQIRCQAAHMRFVVSKLVIWRSLPEKFDFPCCFSCHYLFHDH